MTDDQEILNWVLIMNGAPYTPLDETYKKRVLSLIEMGKRHNVDNLKQFVWEILNFDKEVAE